VLIAMRARRSSVNAHNVIEAIPPDDESIHAVPPPVLATS
jgi:hypothetical protein